MNLEISWNKKETDQLQLERVHEALFPLQRLALDEDEELEDEGESKLVSSPENEIALQLEQQLQEQKPVSYLEVLQDDLTTELDPLSNRELIAALLHTRDVLNSEQASVVLQREGQIEVSTRSVSLLDTDLSEEEKQKIIVYSALQVSQTPDVETVKRFEEKPLETFSDVESF